MKAKYFIIPILIVTFVTAIVAPPAHAELVTLTVVLAAAFASAVFAKKSFFPKQIPKRLQNPTSPIQASRQPLIIQSSKRLVTKQAKSVLLRLLNII